MGKAVIELQKDIITNELEIVSILRKAHMIASKLNLEEFDTWIKNELNGYHNNSSIPEYRNVFGEIKAKNSYYGLIPVSLSSELASELKIRKISNNISEIVALNQQKKDMVISLPAEISKMLCADLGVTFPCYFVFGSHCLNGIIDSVKNTLLEWCLKLEKDGIVGDEFEFSNEEIEKAKTIPQQVNYYGQVFNGNVNNSQVVVGNNNSISLTFNDFFDLIEKIKESINNEQISEQRKKEALDILEDINKSVQQKKKSSIIKSAFIGLKEFLINVGASITASIISSKIGF